MKQMTKFTSNIFTVICCLSGLVAMPSMAAKPDKPKTADSLPTDKATISLNNTHFYSISYLKNINEFQLLSNEDIDVITLEYSGKYNWGDSFVFLDRMIAAADEQSPRKQKNYLEASARISVPFLLDRSMFNLAMGSTSALNSAIKDYLFVGTLEYAYLNIESVGINNEMTAFSSTTTNTLLGLGIAWHGDFFSYLNTNFYYAKNEQQANDYQLTVTFAKSFKLADLSFKTNGYLDWSSAAKDHKTSFHFSPQVLLDLGATFYRAKLLFVGIEYSYWRNKYGLANLDDEHTVSAMVKLSF